MGVKTRRSLKSGRSGGGGEGLGILESMFLRPKHILEAKMEPDLSLGLRTEDEDPKDYSYHI